MRTAVSLRSGDHPSSGGRLIPLNPYPRNIDTVSITARMAAEAPSSGFDPIWPVDSAGLSCPRQSWDAERDSAAGRRPGTLR
jgi:hypothetical protein